jgi:hypothetical protein
LDFNEASLLYITYDTSVWVHHHLDPSGGYVVVHRQRITHSLVSKNEQAKYAKELAMAMVFVQNGYRIEMLEEISGISSPDVRINAMLGDLKHLRGHNNILRDAKKAVRLQGAQVVLFQFDEISEKIHQEINKLIALQIRGYYFVTGENIVHPF